MKWERIVFLLYTSDYKCIKDLPLEQKGALLDAIFEYASTGTIIDLPPIVSMAFNFFAPILMIIPRSGTKK